MTRRRPTRSPGRATNDRYFCELLATHGLLTRTELAEGTGLSKPSTLEIIDRLIDDGLVVPAGTDERVRRGPKAAVFALPAHLGLAIGVEVTGKTIRVRRRTLTGGDLGSTDVRLKARGALATQIAAAIKLSPDDLRFRHRSVVLGLPGAVDPTTGDILFATDLPQWRAGIARDLRTKVDADVTYENEVNLRAVAERVGGAARGLDDFLLLALGHGVGAALILDGRLRRGIHGAAGEIGYLPVPGAGPADGKTIGTYQSVAGAWDLPHAIGREHSSDFAWAYALAEKSPEAPDWSAVAANIGLGLISMISVIDPATIILGGRIAHIAGPTLGTAVADYLSEALPWPAPSVLMSALDDDAVLEGALVHGRRRLRDLAFPASPLADSSVLPDLDRRTKSGTPSTRVPYAP